ncbi:MAG TPA: PHB depolymerase family esterase, partial [Chitinophaga sp.]
MHKLLRCVWLFGLLCCAIDVRAQGDQTSIRVNISSGSTGAWLHLPDDYSTTSTNYPLLIFLHGLGEAGTDLNLVLAHGVPRMIANGAKMQYTVNGKLFKFIVVSPQIPSGWSNEQDIQNLINDVKSRYRIDANRIYLTGLSAGGAGTWNFAASGAKYASNLAALVPVSAAGIDDSKLPGLCTLAGCNVPVWAIGGNLGADLTFLTFLQNYTADINACNPATKAITTVYQGTGHDDGTWDRAYDTAHKYQNPNIYEWMLQYSRTDAA